MKKRSLKKLIIIKLSLTLIFSYFWLFKIRKYKKLYRIISRLDRLGASSMLFARSLSRARKAPIISKLSVIWKMFLFLRTFFLLQIIWGFVKQFFKIFLYQKMKMKDLNIKFMFKKRFTYEIWFDLFICLVLKYLPKMWYFNKIKSNFTTYSKIRSALNLYYSFMETKEVMDTNNNMLYLNHIKNMISLS